HCNCGNCSICQPLLADIENQVKLLDEIISGNSAEMKEEKHIKDVCQTQDLISLNNDKIDSAAFKESASLPTEKYDIMDFDENNKDVSESVTIQFQNNNKIVKASYKNKFTYCSIDEIEELRSHIARLEKEIINKEKLREVSDQQIKSLQMKISICEKDVAEKMAEVYKVSTEKLSIQQENESLQHRVWKAELSERVLQEKYLKKSQSVVSANKQVRDLEQKIGILSRQLRHWESSHREAVNFKEKIQDLEVELQKRRESERKLYAENLHLHHKVESQRERISSMQIMKKDYQMLSSKVDLLEKKKLIVEQSIPSLKNKISQLSQRCKDKDQIINRLDKQVQNRMSPFKDRRQKSNRNISRDENSFAKDEKLELSDESGSYSMSLNHLNLSDNSDSSISPRQTESKSKIPRYTALPSPKSSPRNKTVHFEKTAWEEVKLNNISPKSHRKNQRIKRNSEEKTNEDEQSFAPINFRVTRKVAPDSLLVAWAVPNVEGTLSGYLIFVNNELHQKVRSPNRTKALLNRLDLTQDIEIAIQSLLDNGTSSDKTRLIYPINQIDTSDETPPNSARSLDEKSFKNYKRECIVCKDYTPSDNTQDNKPALELKVNRGDLVTIFGSKSANNFYYAEADGKRGILPSQILQKISALKKRKGSETHSD
uniref:SH3 domain-containing protein n=1 Tax=Strigamia maritima TaxID=126957 RepID=T1JMY7_STRMM